MPRSVAAPVRPRVLLVHDSNEFGGLEMVMLRSIEGLRDRIDFAVLVRGHSATSWTSPPELADRLREMGVPVLRPPDRSAPSLLQPLVELRDIRRSMARWRPDVVHIHTATVEGARKHTFAAWSLRRARVIRTEHNSPSAFSRRPLDTRARRAADRCTSLVLTVSEHDRNEQIELVGRPASLVRCLHNGVDLERFVPRAEPTELQDAPLVVGAVGRLSPQKDFGTLVRAAAQVIGDHADLRVLIAGDGDERHQLAALADQLGVADNVRLLGACDDIVALLDSFDVGVMTSRHEGFPLALLEMMAMGKATVVSDHPGIMEAAVDGETSIVVPIGDVDGFAAALRALLGDAALRRRMGTNARARVEAHFALGDYLSSLEHIYREGPTA